MDLINLSQEQFGDFLLIFLRVGIVLFMLPFYGGALIPTTIKAFLALLISFAIFDCVDVDTKVLENGLIGILYIVSTEIIFGIIIGLIARLYFAAIQLAGELIGFQMGLSIANILDPETGSQDSALSQFGYWIALLIFLLLDGHHLFLVSIKDSFELLNFGSVNLTTELFETIMTLMGKMFELSIKLGAPAITALLLTSAAFGIIARVVPQMNILIVAFPLKIVVGLIFFGFCTEIVIFTTKNFIGKYESMFNTIIRLVSI